jgi:hypothetical protein
MATSQHSSLDFLNTARILNLPNAASAQEPATLAQLNAAIEGLSSKDNVRVATQANISLASPGATVDGVTMATGDRVLVRAQTTASQNGIYVWNGAAVAMTRSADASTSDELENAITVVDEGTSAGQAFRQTTVNFVLDTGNVVWVTFGTSASAATETSAGIAEIATQAEVDAGTDDTRFVTPLKHAQYSGRKLKVAQDIGDGTATQFDITHNFNTRDVVVNVYRTSGNFDNIGLDVSRPSVNAVRLNFASPPSSNQFRCVILG